MSTVPALTYVMNYPRATTGRQRNYPPADPLGSMNNRGEGARATPMDTSDWQRMLQTGETVHTVRSRTALAFLLFVSALLIGPLLWMWFGGRATIGIGLAIVLPFLWLNYLFAAVRFGEGYFEYRDWMLQPRWRRVDYASVVAVAWRPVGRRGGSPDLLFCCPVSGFGSDLKWIPLSTDSWPSGLREAVQQEIISRCGLTDSRPVPSAAIIGDWERVYFGPGTKDLPKLPW